MSKLVYFDTETTGFKPGQICQLSAIVEEDGNIKTHNFFFEVKNIDEGAVKATGRDIEFYKKVASGVYFKDKADEIVELFKDATFVAHNLKFDEGFLSAELWRCNKQVTPKDRIDTMLIFTDIVKAKNQYGKVKFPKLSEVVAHYMIDEDMVRNLVHTWFDCSDNTSDAFHDARFDTACMFVAYQIYKEDLYNLPEKSWRDKFTKK